MKKEGEGKLYIKMNLIYMCKYLQHICNERWKVKGQGQGSHIKRGVCFVCVWNE